MGKIFIMNRALLFSGLFKQYMVIRRNVLFFFIYKHCYNCNHSNYFIEQFDQTIYHSKKRLTINFK